MQHQATTGEVGGDLGASGIEAKRVLERAVRGQEREVVRPGGGWRPSRQGAGVLCVLSALGMGLSMVSVRPGRVLRALHPAACAALATDVRFTLEHRLQGHCTSDGKAAVHHSV